MGAPGAAAGGWAHEIQGRCREIRGDTGEIWARLARRRAGGPTRYKGDAGRSGEIQGRYGRAWRGGGRVGPRDTREMQGDLRRYRGDMGAPGAAAGGWAHEIQGRCREI